MKDLSLAHSSQRITVKVPLQRKSKRKSPKSESPSIGTMRTNESLCRERKLSSSRQKSPLSENKRISLSRTSNCLNESKGSPDSKRTNLIKIRWGLKNDLWIRKVFSYCDNLDLRNLHFKSKLPKSNLFGKQMISPRINWTHFSADQTNSVLRIPDKGSKGPKPSSRQLRLWPFFIIKLF